MICIGELTFWSSFFGVLYVDFCLFFDMRKVFCGYFENILNAISLYLHILPCPNDSQV